MNVQSLHIPVKKSTPAVDFDVDNALLKIEGESYPENAYLFFQDVLKWLEEFLGECDRKITFEIKIPYMNTSSTKVFTDIFDMVEDYAEKGGGVLVRWFYEEDDEDSYYNGVELLQELEFPKEMVPYLDE